MSPSLKSASQKGFANLDQPVKLLPLPKHNEILFTAKWTRCQNTCVRRREGLVTATSHCLYQKNAASLNNPQQSGERQYNAQRRHFVFQTAMTTLLDTEWMSLQFWLLLPNTLASRKRENADKQKRWCGGTFYSLPPPPNVTHFSLLW